MSSVSKLAAMVKRNNPAEVPFSKQNILLYGEPKIGKSTLASKIGNPVFLEVEAGLRNIECDKIPCHTWKHFRAAAQELSSTEHGYDVIVIDTISRLWEKCRAHTLKELGVKHESDMGFGKGWAAVKQEFAPYFYMLTLSDAFGLVAIAHSTIEEVQTPSKTFLKNRVDMPNGCRAIVLPEMEMILFAQKLTEDGETRRLIQSESCEYWEAGDRTGRLGSDIPMDIEAILERYGQAEA